MVDSGRFTNKWFDPRTTPRLAGIVAGLVVFTFIIARLIPSRGIDGPWRVFEEGGDSWLILHIFEIVCLSFMLISIPHGWRRWGFKKAFFFFSFTLAYGFFLEEITVYFSGYYIYNNDAWMQIGHTMLAVPFCWTAIMYSVITLIERNPVLGSLKLLEKGMLAGVLAVSIDISIDAIFVAYGLWHWKEGQWFGVPLANYAAWFMAVGGITAVWYDVDSLPRPQIFKEVGLAVGMALSYISLLFFVLAIYLISRLWFP